MSRAKEPVTTYRQRRELPGAAHARDSLVRFHDLRPGAKLVLTVASFGADLDALSPNGYSGHTSQELAEMTGLTQQVVVAHLRHLTMRHLMIGVTAGPGNPLRYRIPHEAYAASRGEE